MIENTVSTICREQWSVSESEKCGAVIEALRKDSSVYVVPVTDEAGDPIGLIDKNAALIVASNPLHYSVMQNRSASNLMQDRYIRFDEGTSIDLVVNQLINEGFSLSQGGFIVTRNGHYVGVGVNTDTLSYLVNINNLRARELAKLNEEMTDSVRYASRIQGGLLPHKKLLHNKLSTIDVIWEPRDIVGGDIYWRSEENNKDFFTLGLIDCTGHGVPGAMLSLLVSNSLERIYANNTEQDPASALLDLDHYVRTGLNQDKVDSESDDGCDAAILRIDRDKQTIEFAGAKLGLFQVTAPSQVIRHQGARCSLGYQDAIAEVDRPQLKTIQYEAGDTFAIVTDGITDQIGGANGKTSYGYRRLEQMLSAQCTSSAHEITQEMSKDFAAWQGANTGRDDVTVVVFRL